MSGLRSFMSSVAMVSFMGIGFVLWSVIAPGEDRRKELLKVTELKGFLACVMCTVSLFPDPPGECPHDWVRTFFGGFLSQMNNAAGAEASRRGLVQQNLPESNPVRMEETRRRNALVMQALKDAAETNDNIAREMPGPWK